MLRAGIVGLPNVGKSTLFNAITKSAALAANYPFATIDPNVGVVTLKDNRLDVLANMYKSGRIVPTTVEFTDIAGLVKGASKGEGLGNQFLSHIRDVDTICQVVRLFKDDNIIHVEGSVDPLRDIDIIQLELNISDYDSISKRIPKIEKKAKVGGSSDEKEEYELLIKIKQGLEDNTPIRLMDLTNDEKNIIKSYN
jgi:GTP-binding protein YchF